MPVPRMPVVSRIRRLFVPLAAIVAALATGATPPAAADDGAGRYPDRPIRMIVGWPPGGVADTGTRRLTALMEKTLGVNIVVENRAGASAQIAAETVARAAPDGYTLLASDIVTHAINPCVFPKLRYDPLKDFAPISMRSRSPMLLVTHAGTSIRSVNDLVRQSRGGAEPMAFASPSLGAPQNLTMELFARLTGARLRAVLYKGEAPALVDVIGGQLPVMITFPSTAQPHVQAGKLRALAVTHRERIPAFPDVPTFTELGWPALESYSWGSFHAPAGTPRAIIDKLRDAVVKANRTREVQDYAATFAVDPISSTPEELLAWNRREIERLCAIVQQAGIRME